MNDHVSPIKIDAFSVMGISVRTKTRNEIGSDEPQIPDLWERFFKEVLPHTPAAGNPSTPLFGVYSSYESNQHGSYTVTAGTALVDVEDVPEGYDVVSVDGGEYIAFEGRGMMPEVVVETWQKVWDYFDNQEIYQRRFTTDFEKYLSDDHVMIHIGIERCGN